MPCGLLFLGRLGDCSASPQRIIKVEFDFVAANSLCPCAVAFVGRQGIFDVDINPVVAFSVLVDVDLTRADCVIKSLRKVLGVYGVKFFVISHRYAILLARKKCTANVDVIRQTTLGVQLAEQTRHDIDHESDDDRAE